MWNSIRNKEQIIEFWTNEPGPYCKKVSGRFQANVNFGLESDSLGELKKGSDYAFGKIKSGVKATRKKLKSLWEQIHSRYYPNCFLPEDLIFSQ